MKNEKINNFICFWKLLDLTKHTKQSNDFTDSHRY